MVVLIHHGSDEELDACDIMCHYGLTYSGKLNINEFLEEDFW